MELIALRGVTLQRPGAPDAPPLLAGADVALGDGTRLGLVGRSGAGKSTLLRVMAGLAVPSSGRVVRAPGVRVAFLPQDASPDPAATVWEAAAAGLAEARAVESRLREAERGIAAGDPGAAARYEALLSEHDRLGGYGAEARLREVLHALGLPAERRDDRVGGLSAGERRRVALAAVLAAPADVVLLDEPTNHLDVASRAWLERHLAGRGGALVVVSHDRALLSAATNATAFVAGGRLRVYAGGYDRAARRAAADDASTERRAREMRRESERLAKVAAELARFGRRSRARERRATDLASAAAERAGEPTRARDPLLLGSAAARRTRGRLLSADGLAAPPAVTGVDVRLSAGDRVALMGPNGSGKSTLLGLLAGGVRSEDPRSRLEFAPGLRLVHVGQVDRGLPDGEPVLEQLARQLGAERARSLLATAGLPFPSWSLPPERLSGGERARAGLALALALSPDLLLLDEPDNDLDLAAVEALERSLLELAEAGGAFVIATHDRRLAEATCRRAWELDAGRLVAYASVRAFLRGEAAVPVTTFFADGPDLPEASGEPRPEPDPLAAVESEREALLATLSDPVGSSERDLARARERLRAVEGEILARLDARFPPPAPRYSFRERGMAIVADRVAGAAEPTWVVAPGQAAGAAGTDAEVTPRVELRLLGDVAHLKAVAPEGSCLVPVVAAALLDAGARLAFTVAGARRAQAYVPTPAPGTLLAPGDGGWRFLDLGGFLALEGWLASDGSAQGPRGGSPR